MARHAARRGIAFGFAVKSAAGDELEERRTCEAVMQQKVVGRALPGLLKHQMEGVRTDKELGVPVDRF